MTETQNQVPAQRGGTPDTHVTVNAIALFIGGGLTLFAGLIAFLATQVTSQFLDQYDPSGAAAFWTEFGGVIAMFVLVALGLPAILAGIGLSRRQEWGRILALVVAAFNGLVGLTLFVGNFLALLNFAYAIYAFWSLLQPDVVALFQQPAASGTA